MHYFKHAELVENYHVSLKTVHNWIDAARQKKINLQLVEKNNRTYVANTPENLLALLELAEQGKKYRNSVHHKIANPKPEFYDLFNKQQILDIITNLSIHYEVPRQYNYFNEGAVNWDRYAEHMAQDPGRNTLKATIELIDANIGAIDRLIDGVDRVNVVDIALGNAMPSRGLLEYLVKKGVLNRYVAVDISAEMLRIAERNIKEWFGDAIKFEGYVKDITREHLDDLLVDDMLESNYKTMNLALLLGSTPVNFRKPDDPLKIICDSLGPEDIILYTQKPDTEVARRYFNFNPQPGAAALSPNHRFIFDLFNIDDSLYDVEMGFNEKKRMRYVRVRLKTALTIKFQHNKIDRAVSFNKGDTILLFRAWHQTTREIINEFEEAGFTLLHSSLTRDRQFLLTISGVDVKAEEV